MERERGSLFGRRRGKALSQLQRSMLESCLPALLLDLAEPPPIPLAAIFPVPVGEVRLEIGFGGGEHLIHEAKESPHVGFIGIEPFRNGLAKAVSAIVRDQLRNVRLFDRDAALLLDWLPPASLARIELLYPDPWPKSRHWKRRFVRADNIERMARSLADGGSLRFASDVEGYVRWTLREMTQSGRFAWTAAAVEECREPWPGWPGTRYEARAIAEGRRPVYLEFRKSVGAGSAPLSPLPSAAPHAGS